MRRLKRVTIETPKPSSQNNVNHVAKRPNVVEVHVGLRPDLHFKIDMVQQMSDRLEAHILAS
jgi:hypothetical protein